MQYKEKLNVLYENAREKTIQTMIDKINSHSWVPIRNTERAARLINERSKDSIINHSIFSKLSKDMRSTSLFKKPNVDPTLCVVMVDINYLSSRKGNAISQSGGFKSVDSIIKIIKKGKKLDDVPGFSLRLNQVDEGNHRVEALKQLGYSSCPCYLWNGWD